MGVFLLGRLYLYGTDDIQKDKEKALEWLKLSAEQGNEYAQNMIDNIHSFENAVSSQYNIRFVCKFKQVHSR